MLYTKKIMFVLISATFAFTKATIADNQTPTAKSNISGVNIKWTPTPTK
jgi:uncharacterized membrane protein